MSKKLLSITVTGNEKSWSFNFYGDIKNIDGWRKDGLIIDEIVNIIPAWVCDIGMARPWCLLQDVFNFSWRPGRKG